MVTTSAPACRRLATSCSHCARLTSWSTLTSRCIHGLISYRTPKCSGGHMRYRRPHPSSVTAPASPTPGLFWGYDPRKAPTFAASAAQGVGELVDERAHVGDDAERLVAAAVGELGDDGL